MSQMTKRNFASPEETRTFEKGRVDVINLGGLTFGRAVFQPGWKWSECVKSIAGTESCQAAHLAYQISGRLHVVMDNGETTEYGPGDLSFIPPGHDAWVVGNEPVVVVDVQGMANYARR